MSCHAKKSSPFLRIEEHFSEIAQIPVITVFENRLPETPRFTFAIPTFKRVETLRETLESVFNQDIAEPYEIIVSDNNPERDDETEKLMTEYADLPNLTYVKNAENLGMAGNWNRLALLTRGEYMVLLHDDDCVAPFFLSSASALLKQHPDADLLQFAKTHEKKFEFHPEFFYARRFRFYDNLEHNVINAPTGTVYRREAIIRLGGWNYLFYPSQDYCFDHLLMCHGYKAYMSPLQATFYRVSINLSLKKETQIGFVKIDTALRDSLLRHIGMPAFIRRPYLELRNEMQLERWGLKSDDILPLKVGCYSLNSKRIAGVLTFRYIQILSRLAHLAD